MARRIIRKKAARKINQNPENFNKMLLDVSTNCGEEKELQPWGTCSCFNWMTQVWPVQKDAPLVSRLCLRGLFAYTESHFLAPFLQPAPCPIPAPIPLALVASCPSLQGPLLTAHSWHFLWQTRAQC